MFGSQTLEHFKSSPPRASNSTAFTPATQGLQQIKQNELLAASQQIPNNLLGKALKQVNKQFISETQQISPTAQQQEQIYSSYPPLMQQDNGVSNSLDDINADVPDKLTDCVNDTVGYRWDIASLKSERTQLQNEADTFRKLVSLQDAKIKDMMDQNSQLDSQLTIARSIIDNNNEQIERLTALNRYANFKYNNVFNEYNKCIEFVKNNITT